jgi:hypothetical protein
MQQAQSLRSRLIDTFTEIRARLEVTVESKAAAAR